LIALFCLSFSSVAAVLENLSRLFEYPLTNQTIEAILPSVERNNNREQRNNAMKKQIGTVLPTAASIKCSNEFAKREFTEREAIANRELKGCDRKVVGGEVRYYDTTDQYAIVSRQGKVLWFAVTPDGDFRI
jgi:hypothetical protein